GHHCAQPIMNFFQIPATVRASFSIYNTQDDIDILINAIESTQKLFNRL
ncbi:MAG TPA: aminotransferase class V-fold PLP-dependent enzyme, partial [Candidatus Bathyarchaeia archaeon]|nr:aminotransferase class V-fold PLP-dependent enzyme [Candidatus Bathyarchaeia archaeon]